MKYLIPLYGLVNFAAGIAVGAVGLLTLLAYGVIRLPWLTLHP